MGLKDALFTMIEVCTSSVLHASFHLAQTRGRWGEKEQIVVGAEPRRAIDPCL
jgi:hypothetical protein